MKLIEGSERWLWLESMREAACFLREMASIWERDLLRQQRSVVLLANSHFVSREFRETLMVAFGL